MLDAEACKQEIVNKCKEMLEFIKSEFDPKLTDEEVKQTLDVRNWKQDYKERCKYYNVGGFERFFDCRPFDSQLRAYVYSDSTDSDIISIDVHGE